MPANSFDVIVLGVGSMGAAACYQLAQQGYKVLGIEQFNIPHEQGSHGGQSRIIRKAYFEHPDYVPLLNRAYHNWRQLEEQTGEQLYFKTGLLYSGPSHHPVIQGVRETSALYGVETINVPRNEVAAQYTAFATHDRHDMILEPDAGFLLSEKAITLFTNEATKKGAEIRTNEKTVDWKMDGDIIKVTTEKNSYSAAKLIITAGAWAGKMTPQLTVPLKVTRQILIWVKPGQPALFSPGNFPCWMIATEENEGVYYGFPYLDGRQFGGPSGLKIALHYPGEETSPDKVDREISQQELGKIIDGLKNYLPVATSEVVAAKTCLYTNTPDEHFIIDHLPGYKGAVTIACGFSGHGFKFASVIGEILADLSIKGKTELPAGFLSLERFKSNPGSG